MCDLINQYKQEQALIVKYTAEFANFLKNFAIVPYNDAYKSYIKYLIDR